MNAEKSHQHGAQKHQTGHEHVHSDHPIIDIGGLSFSYSGEQPVLKDINLKICEGDFVGLIGPNGGGKSTLLKLIVGILQIQNGSIKLFGKELKDFKEWHRIGYVSQNAAHFDRRFPATVWEIVSMGRISQKGFFKSFNAEDKKMIEQSLKDVDMLEYKDRPLYQLSGGQQQRVFIARALSSNPSLLALDEPTIGIDVKVQEEFYLLLQKLRKEKNLTIILVSHDIDVIATQANIFACLNQELVFHGEPKDFIKDDYMEKLYGKNLRLILHGH